MEFRHGIRTYMTTIAGAAVALASLAAEAQPYPSKPVEFVVHTSAGGGTDLFARVVTEIITREKLLPQPMLVNNRVGGGGTIAYNYIKTRRGDPYAVMTIATGALLTAAARPELGLGLDNYTPLAFFAIDPQAIMVSAESKFTTLKDFMDAAKREPNSLICALSSPGGSGRIALYMLERESGAKFKYVSFKGGSDAILSVLGGHTHFSTENISEALAQIEAKKMRILAVTTEKRLAQFPDAPTLSELGVNVVFGTGRAFAMPAGVPKEAAAIMEAALEKAHKSKIWKDFAERNVFEDRYMNGEQTAAYLAKRQVEMVDFLQAIGLAGKP